MRRVAHLAQGNDLHVVLVGKRPSKILGGTDHAPHMTQVTNQKCDPHWRGSSHRAPSAAIAP
ncbi:hypothetical protein GCM10023257_65130 [Streptomyces hyderabadensis]|uniref:UspA domain-containing protein n=1 Tax=Streptomyces hyderabadensis TaxID=598549 RepID=A0ABP9ITF6_9ACTN